MGYVGLQVLASLFFVDLVGHEVLPISEEELQELPGRVIVYMSTKHPHRLLEKFLNPVYTGKELLICANFTPSEALRTSFLEMIQFLEACEPEDWMNSSKTSQALALQDECRRLFDAEKPAKA